MLSTKINVCYIFHTDLYKKKNLFKQMHLHLCFSLSKKKYFFFKTLICCVDSFILNQCNLKNIFTGLCILVIKAHFFRLYLITDNCSESLESLMWHQKPDIHVTLVTLLILVPIHILFMDNY